MNRNEQTDNAVDKMIRNAMDTDMPDEVDQRLRGHLRIFRERLAMRGRFSPFDMGRPWPLARLAAAFLAAALLLFFIGTFVGGSTPSWAEVAEQFGSAPFLNATIYVKSHALAEPVQIEIWMGQGGKLRMRAGHEIIFGENGRIIERVAIGDKEGPRPDLEYAQGMLQDVIRDMSKAETFSLETLIAALPIDGQLSAPLENQLARVSNDMVVFDITPEASPDWVRIWALRESRLPVRLLYWHPETGENVDVVLSYGGEPPSSFFDPETFQAHLSENASPVDIAYALVKDIGGRPLAPQDIQR